MKRIILSLALQFPMVSIQAASFTPQERIWVDLKIIDGNRYDESLQRTHVVDSAADSTELRRIVQAQSTLVTIQNMQIVRSRNGATTTQVLVNATEKTSGKLLSSATLEQALTTLQPGDIIDYALNIHHPQLLPANQLSLHYSLRRQMVFGDGRITVRVPKYSALQVSAKGFDQQATQTSGNQRVYTYTVRNDKPVVAEMETANPESIMPIVRASTFRDYHELATLIRKEFAKAFVPSTALDRVAQDIAAENHDPRAAAQASFRWVQQNIGYDVQAMDANGITPRKLPDILANRHGDCKDHVVVLQALLRAQGLESVPALINTENQYELLALPVVADFNHVITYIPALNLYVDATDKYAQFDSLPFNRQDKPVLLLAQKVRQERTPLSAATSSVTEAHYHLDRWKMIMRSQTTSTGDSALETALVRDAMQGQDLGDLLRRSLTARGLGEPQGTMSFVGDSERINFIMSFDAGLQASQEHSGAISLNPFFSNRSTLATIGHNFQRAQRSNDFLCPPRTIAERYTVELPLGSKAMLPPSVNMQAGEIAYQSSYTQQDNSVTVSRTYTNTSKQAVCSVRDYPRYHQLAQSINLDIYTPIKYTWP
ncbi:hypothetical protein GTP56_17260 [Duganella sp. FT134W]|uniref:Transglutaminase-like domain-containing protein n=1 Tax=Duganella margarita TaxID=2692170 RepID=A0A7X4H389_9BURK|nr:transglutaminase domain-containing protein [Duganella margarita]MYM73936.1 hypothetical protein [Duganella margarita]